MTIDAAEPPKDGYGALKAGVKAWGNPYPQGTAAFECWKADWLYGAFKADKLHISLKFPRDSQNDVNDAIAIVNYVIGGTPVTYEGPLRK